MLSVRLHRASRRKYCFTIHTNTYTFCFQDIQIRTKYVQQYVRIRTWPKKIRLCPPKSCRRKDVRIRTYSYVFVRICVRIAYVLCTYCTYSYVSYVIFTPTGFRQKIRTQYVRYVRYVRNTYANTYANTYEYVHNRISFCTFVFVRIAYVFVRIVRIVRIIYVRTQLVSVLRHLLSRGLAGLCIHDAEAIRSRVLVRQVSLAFDILELAFCGLT